MSKNKKKILFLDRDGTILVEPEDYQVDALEKFAFLPEVISSLKEICSTTDYLLVMVTNQDGLGTDSLPEDVFHRYQDLMLRILSSEGIGFAGIHVDHSFASDNLPSRKPGTAMLKKYLEDKDYDLEHSFVIGDRMTDMQLAANLKAKGILLGRSADHSDDSSLDLEALKNTIVLETVDWKDIVAFLSLPERKAKVKRKTKETRIRVRLNLDGKGEYDVDTGLRFLDHMLEQLSKHSGIDLQIRVKGDLDIDEHHTMEDTALALGKAFRKALGKKHGISRYGFMLPMDDALAQVAIDFSGRPWLEWKVQFSREKIGDVPTEMFMHFFKSFSDEARCNLNIRAEGENEHHKIEAIFKAFARSIKMAVSRDASNPSLPSTKGKL